MKNNMLATLVAPLTLVLTSICGAQAPYEMQLAGSNTPSEDISVKSFISFVPKENTVTPTEQSATWAAAAANWMDILKDSTLTKGIGYSAVGKQSAPDYQWMVTSNGFKSWAAGLTTESQWGNRTAISIEPQVLKAGITFRPRDIVYTAKSYAWTASEGWKTDVINLTASFASSNYFRHRLNSDGTLAASQDLALPSTRFRYGGLMVGISGFGSGDNAQKLSNVVDYYMSTHTVLWVSVTIPYNDNGVDKTFSTSLAILPTGSDLILKDVETPLTLDLANSRVLLGDATTPADPHTLYLIERTTDLQNWTPVYYPNFGNGTQMFYGVQTDMPRQFFRVRQYAPTPAAAAGAAHALRNGPPPARPVDDSVAL